MPPAAKTKEFDPSLLQSMQEPITAAIFKVVGNTQTPINLPVKQGYEVSGAGLTREDVQKIATGDVVRESARAQGLPEGGIYVVQLADQNGMKHRFELAWPVNMPPGFVPAYAPPGYAPPIQPNYSAPWPPPQQSGYGGFGYAQPQPQASPSPWPGQWQPNYGQPWQPNYHHAPPPWMWGQPPQPIATPAPSTVEIQLRDTVAASERARLEDKHQADLRAMAAAHAQEMHALREEMRRMVDRQPGPSPEISALQAVVAQLQNDLRTAREDAQRARDEAAHRTEMMRLESKIDLLSAQPKNDPMIPFMQEQARQQAETVKAIASSSKESMDLMMRVMMNPAQAMEMAKALSAKPTELLESFNGVMNMYQNAFQMLSQGGGGNPIADAITAGVGGISEAVKALFKSKGIEASSNAQIAQAQAAAMQAQAMAMSGSRPVGFAGPPPVIQLPAGQVPVTGEITTPAQPAPSDAAKVEAKPEEKPSQPALDPETVKHFGADLAPHVLHLRARVAGTAVGPDGAAIAQPTPQEVGDYVFMAVKIAEEACVKQRKQIHEEVPAFALFNPQGLPRMLSLLLPDAPQAFVDAVHAHMVSQLTEQPEEEEEEEEDDGDDEPIAATASA